MLTNKVGRIAYTNTEPYFYHWPNEPFRVVSGFPRQLALAARDGEILAAPLPTIECWKLDKTFAPLGFWGIASRESCRSVILLSHKPISELNDVVIGVTRESSMSVALLQVLIRQRYGHRVTLRRGLLASDDAWLMIGDQAFMEWSKPRLGPWEHVTDLGSEWWDWHQLPFVFARWVVRRDAGYTTEGALVRIVGDSLRRGIVSLPTIAVKQSILLRIPSPQIVDYLQRLIYVLGREEERSMWVFRELLERTTLQPTLA